MDKKNNNRTKNGKEYIKELFKQGGMYLSVGVLASSLSGNLNQAQNFIQLSNDPEMSGIAQVFVGAKAPIYLVDSPAETDLALNLSRLRGGVVTSDIVHSINNSIRTNDGLATPIRQPEIENSTRDGNVVGCIINGRNITNDFMTRIATNTPGLESDYAVSSQLTLQRYIVAHEAGHCLHMEHRNFHEDISTKSNVVNVQRMEIIADFIAGAALAISTEASQRENVHRDLLRIQDARNISGFGRLNTSASLTHNTGQAISAGWHAGLNRSPRHMPQIMNLARNFALETALQPEHAGRITNELQNIHVLVDSLITHKTRETQQRLNPQNNIIRSIQIEDSVKAHARFNIALSQNLSQDVRQIIERARDGHISIMQNNQLRNTGLSIDLMNLSTHFRNDPNIQNTLRDISRQSLNQPLNYTIRHMETIQNNTDNQVLRRNMQIALENISLDRQIYREFAINQNIIKNQNTQETKRSNDQTL